MPFIGKTTLLAGLAVVALMATSAVSAETLKFKADLKGSSEVPPNDSAGQGMGEVTFDTATKKLTWTVTSSGMSGEATAAHFHGPAAPGENAGPVVDISKAIASGSAEITDEQLADLHGISTSTRKSSLMERSGAR